MTDILELQNTPANPGGNPAGLSTISLGGCHELSTVSAVACG